MVTKETEIELDDRNDEKPRSSVVSFAIDLPEKGEDDDDHESKDENEKPGRTSVHFPKSTSDSIWTEKTKTRTKRAGSIYVKSRRFSRYGNLGNFFKPYLTKVKPKKNEIPIDSVGMMNNLSFWWINKYKVNEKKLKKLAMEKLLPMTNDDDERDNFAELQLPMPTPKERTAINQKRLLGKFKDEEQSKEQERRSMYQVLWSFSKTRILITTIPHVILLAIVLVFPFLFKLTTDSIHDEFMRINNSKQYERLTDTAFMSSQSDFLSALAEYNGPNKTQAEGVNFLEIYLQTMKYFTEHHRNETWNPKLQDNPEMSMKYFKHIYEKQEKRVLQDKNRYIYGGVMTVMLLLFFLNRNLVNFLNLRTAIRFRSACLGAAYKKSMKSIVTYRIAPHQLMSLAMDESEILMTIATKGLSMPLIHAKLIIITIFYATVIFHINLTLGVGFVYIVIFPLIAGLISRIASFYLKKSRKYRSQKLTLIEEFLINFKTVLMYQYQRTMIDKFTELIRKEFSSMRKKINWSARFIPEFISIFLFAIVLLEQPGDLKNPNENLVLFIYILTVQCLMTDLFEGIDAYVKAQPTLVKLKSIFQLQPSNISKSIPPATTVLSIKNGIFNWYRWMDESWKHNKMDVLITQKTAQLNISEFSVLRNQIVGVTGPSGSGKTMLLYAILGHTNWDGRVQQKGSFSFFPSSGYLSLDTLKENLILNASYNRDCIDDALSIVGLDEAFGDHRSLGEQIGNLELTADQLDRLVLAQAIYSENDLILLDNPMSRSDARKYEENLEIFRNVIENLLIQKKSVIIATQNTDFLKCCHNIYYLEGGSVAHEGAFKDLAMEKAFNEMIENSQTMQHYNNKVDFSGITPSGIHPRISRNQEFGGYSQRSIFLIIILGIFALTGVVAYFAMPTLRVVQSLASDSMLVLFILSSIVAKILSLFFTNLFTSSASQKAIINDKIKLKQLLRTSMNYLYSSSLAEIIQKFAENNFFDTLHLSNSIENFFGIVVTVAISSYICPWLAIIYAVILVKLMFVYKFYKRTSKYLHEKIYQTNVMLYKEMTNHIRGRVALQSIPGFDKYLKHFYDLIDANSIAVFLHKSMVYHTQFLVQMFMVVGFVALVFLTLLLDPDNLHGMEINFGFGVFLFLCFCDHSNRLMANLFEMRGDSVRDERLHKWLVEVDQRKTNDHIVENLNMTATPIGYCVTIQDLVVKMGNVVNLSVSKLDIKSGEKVRVYGHGSQYLVPMLSRILTPKTGIIFFGGTDIWAFSDDAIKRVIGFIPYHVQANSKTIRAIIDPRNDHSTDFLIEILGTFNLLTNITNTELIETISVLTLWEKQILCLVRLYITKPKIIVIENPHPKAIAMIESTIQTHFETATVIFIGSNNYNLCTRTVNLDDI